jgi:hypothetical protein
MTASRKRLGGTAEGELAIPIGATAYPSSKGILRLVTISHCEVRHGASPPLIV